MPLPASTASATSDQKRAARPPRRLSGKEPPGIVCEGDVLWEGLPGRALAGAAAQRSMKCCAQSVKRLASGGGVELGGHPFRAGEDHLSPRGAAEQEFGGIATRAAGGRTSGDDGEGVVAVAGQRPIQHWELR